MRKWIMHIFLYILQEIEEDIPIHVGYSIIAYKTI